MLEALPHYNWLEKIAWRRPGVFSKAFSAPTFLNRSSSTRFPEILHSHCTHIPAADRCDKGSFDLIRTVNIAFAASLMAYSVHLLQKPSHSLSPILPPSIFSLWSTFSSRFSQTSCYPSTTRAWPWHKFLYWISIGQWHASPASAITKGKASRMLYPRWAAQDIWRSLQQRFGEVDSCGIEAGLKGSFRVYSTAPENFYYACQSGLRGRGPCN